ncbi:nitrite reductase small subunit NirD [Paenibacillus alkaliterrae]|uniref:nitrite reductase small subunit NirD n=1 Tax=Paenibacillus alkaliterrae TaxID=320909 RepID=UPI001F2505E3|nr:nitrite reductase small subunit NirD [Paenibacillus alkaliterrae]MCF2939965.1 nitrite reductase small subunit NirD [Paenibacillus alkaliterrae]
MKQIKIGHISEIESMRSRVISIGDLEIALFKLSNGEIKAIENKCPHKGGKLSEGIVCDHHVFCPLHDWKINLNDGQVQDPDEGCVVSFRVEADPESGDLFIHLEDKAYKAS